MVNKIDGFVDPIALVIIVACFAVGTVYMVKSKQIDAPAEQAAEAILKAKGIDVDFSSEKKHSNNPKDIAEQSH